MIEQGLLFVSELHDCEVFWGDCQVTQCFNCYTYGHTARHCKNHMRYGFCATIGHASRDCPKREDSQAYRCGVCKGGQRHPAWSPECPVRKIKVREARQAYLARPSCFQTRANPTTQIPTRSAASPEASTIPSSQPPSATFPEASSPAVAELAPASDPFAEDSEESEQPKRKRGRPSPYKILPRHSQGSRDIRTALLRPNE